MDPNAKFGAISTPTCGCSSRSSRKDSTRSSVQPVVPTTACTPCSTAKRTFVAVAVGTVKSTIISALVSTSFSRESSRPKAATNSRSGASVIALTASDPIRPDAPRTATRRILACVASTILLPPKLTNSPVISTLLSHVVYSTNRDTMLLMYYAPSTLKHQHNTLIDTKISGNRVS